MDKEIDISIAGVDERIESYLRGTMSADEEAAFKQEIKSNPELRSRAMEMTALAKGLRTRESNKERPLTNKERYLKKSIVADKSTEKETRTRAHTFLWWACSAAAVCVIFFSVFKAQRYRTLDAAISPYYTQYDINDIARGDTDSATVAHLYSLFEQVQRQHNMTNIIKELEPIYASLNSDYTYYPYANDIAWNLALAYIKDDQINKAIPILEKLKEDSQDSPISVKSDELLQKIRDLK